MKGINKVNKKYDLGIAFARVLAMVMIIFTHISQEITSIAFIGQILNLGVYIFLIISGYLANKSKINNYLAWLKRRFIKLLVPYFLFLLIYFLYRFIIGEFNLNNLLIYCSTLQLYFPETSESGIGHLWFISIILICYILTPLFKIIADKMINNSSTVKLLIVLVIILVWGLSLQYFQNPFNYTFIYILTFATSFWLPSLVDRVAEVKNIILHLILAFLAGLIRVLSLRYLDGTVVYDVFVVSITSFVIGYSLFLCYYDIYYYIKDGKFDGIITYFDSISYEIYLVHYAFILGPFYYFDSSNIFRSILIVLTYTFISAVLLKRISDYIINNIITLG